MNVLHGLSAFPLTPFAREDIDERAYARLIDRLAGAGVDSITALGSTGSYAYLTREERLRVTRVALEHAAGTPVIVGIGALRTRSVIELADDAQAAGAAGVLLAPVSYQALTRDDVFGLYESVTAALSVPLVVYDNPGTTHFAFDDDLYAAVARLPHVASIKIPGVPGEAEAARARIQRLREILPGHVTIGVSGDASAVRGLLSGCDVWYSVIAGTLPGLASELARAAAEQDAAGALAASDRLQPLWSLFARHGSLRVTAAIAEELGLVGRPSLPLPIRGLQGDDLDDVRRLIHRLELTGGA